MTAFLKVQVWDGMSAVPRMQWSGVRGSCVTLVINLVILLFCHLHVVPVNSGHGPVSKSGNVYELIFGSENMFRIIRPGQHAGKTPALARVPDRQKNNVPGFRKYLNQVVSIFAKC